MVSGVISKLVMSGGEQCNCFPAFEALPQWLFTLFLHVLPLFFLCLFFLSPPHLAHTLPHLQFPFQELGVRGSCASQILLCSLRVRQPFSLGCCGSIPGAHMPQVRRRIWFYIEDNLSLSLLQGCSSKAIAQREGENTSPFSPSSTASTPGLCLTGNWCFNHNFLTSFLQAALSVLCERQRRPTHSSWPVWLASETILQWHLLHFPASWKRSPFLTVN